jgi:hypothetical protein
MRSRADKEAHWAAGRGNPDALSAALDRKEFRDWDGVMEIAVCSGTLDCVKVLYDKGYEQRRPTGPYLHPAVLAMDDGQLEILRFVVDRSGPPPPSAVLWCEGAVKGGVEMLKYVQELGCVFGGEITEAAAEQGDLEALRYLHMTGAPWDFRTLVAALMADSLPCLQYAHMHGCPQEVPEARRCRVLRAPSLPVLRYVCEHMDATFASRMLEGTASALAETVDRRRGASELRAEGLDWPLVLYLGRKLGSALPEALAEAKATQTERALALAGVFWKAGKQLRVEEMKLLHRKAAGGEDENQMCKMRKITYADAERMALWDAMARVPKELQERIAAEAELIML